MPIAHRLAALAVAATLLLALVPAAGAQCVGDCNGGGRVEINELIAGVSIAIGLAPLSQCGALDLNGSGTVTIEELIAAVSNALSGCPPTPTPPDATQTATATATATDTAVPTQTVSAVDTATATAPATVTATAPPTDTATTLPTDSPTASTASPTSPPDATATVSPTASGVPSSTATASPTATAPDATVTPSATDGEMSTATPTATFTPTTVPTGPAAVCGNGFLEPGETCAGCPPDCVVGQCTATATTATFQITFQGALGTTPITATTLVGYRGDHVSLPGTGTAVSVRQRVTFPPPLPNTIAINDLDYAVRVVVGRTAGLSGGLLYSIKFDTCQGAPAVTAADFACTMEACAGPGGAINGCTCNVTAP